MPPNQEPTRELLVDRIAKTKEILSGEKNLIRVKGKRVLVIGDLHGDLVAAERVRTVFEGSGFDALVFLGDYVDRGDRSVATLSKVMDMKVKASKKVFMLRGNHEHRRMNYRFGFMDELMNIYDDKALIDDIHEMYRHLPVAALVNNNFFLVHGGISSGIHKLESINRYDRTTEEPKEELSELYWNDPEPGVPGFEFNRDRGSHKRFGRRALERFLENNGLSALIRSHQYVAEGYKYMWDKKLFTIFTTQEYMPWTSNPRCACIVDDKGAEVMNIDEQG